LKHFEMEFTSMDQHLHRISRALQLQVIKEAVPPDAAIRAPFHYRQPEITAVAPLETEKKGKSRKMG
jgi:hypothetical protein